MFGSKMSFQKDLFLHEEIMLLALNKEGKIASGIKHIYCAIGGAILAELLLTNRVNVDGSEGKTIVPITNPQKFNNPILDECFDEIKNTTEQYRFTDWALWFSDIKDLSDRVANQLCQRGILRATEGRIKFLFKRKIYPEFDPGPKMKLIEKLKTAIFSEKEVDPRTLILVLIARDSKILKTLFDKKELKTREKRIEKIFVNTWGEEIVNEEHKAVRVAISVAIEHVGYCISNCSFFSTFGRS